MELCSFMLLALTTVLLTILQPLALNSICLSCTFVEQVELITGTLTAALDERPITIPSWSLSPVFGAHPCAPNGTGCYTDGASLAPVDPVLEDFTSGPGNDLPPLLKVNGRQGPSWLDQAGQLFQPAVDALASTLSSILYHPLLQLGLFGTAILIGSCVVFPLMWASQGQNPYDEEIQAKKAQVMGKITLAMAEFDSQISIMFKQIEEEQERLCTEARDTMLAKMNARCAALSSEMLAEFDRRLSLMAGTVSSTTVEPASPSDKSDAQLKSIDATLAAIKEKIDQTSQRSLRGSASEQPSSSAQSTQDDTVPEEPSQTSMAQFSLQRWQAAVGYNPTPEEFEEGRQIRQQRVMRARHRLN